MKPGVPWKKWGPYLSERQWGTVREDYSNDGNAWDYFSHDQSRSRTYRWGEDGIAGISDDKQQLCFAIALWNGHDPILKERFFGLTNSRGQPRRGRQRVLLLSGQHADALVHEVRCTSILRRNTRIKIWCRPTRRRSRDELEYELLDTGIFDEDRYFDVFVEYAKADPEDVLIRISVHNRGPESAQLHLLPTLWFRNTWSWADQRSEAVSAAARRRHRARSHRSRLGEYTWQCEGASGVLFTDNESNASACGARPAHPPTSKMRFTTTSSRASKDAVNPSRTGTKAAALYVLDVPAGGSEVVRLRLEPQGHQPDPFDVFR